jgi:hypothetical protein
MTDFRALCAELLNVIDSLPCETNYKGESRYVFPIDEDVIFRARAALAQPEPHGPTDEELDEFAVFWWGSDTDKRTVTDIIECCSMTAYTRAVLARWGNQ